MNINGWDFYITIAGYICPVALPKHCYEVIRLWKFDRLQELFIEVLEFLFTLLHITVWKSLEHINPRGKHY